MSAFSRESALFILFFLVWATAAAAYVLYHGLQDDTRSRCEVGLGGAVPTPAKKLRIVAVGIWGGR